MASASRRWGWAAPSIVTAMMVLSLAPPAAASHSIHWVQVCVAEGAAGEHHFACLLEAPNFANPCKGVLKVAVTGPAGTTATAGIACGNAPITLCTATATAPDPALGLWFGECERHVTGQNPLICVLPADPAPGSGWAVVCSKEA